MNTERFLVAVFLLCLIGTSALAPVICLVSRLFWFCVRRAQRRITARRWRSQRRVYAVPCPDSRDSIAEFRRIHNA